MAKRKVTASKKAAKQTQAKNEPKPKKRALPQKEEQPESDNESVIEKDEWWKQVYLCGCEWDHYDKVFQEVDWQFANLEKAFAPDGVVGQSDMFVYVFGLTERE
jgi:hypothetical protein